MSNEHGFTFAELLLGAAILAFAIVVLLGGVLQVTTLTEHTRNLSLAANDAGRVLEQLRLQNTNVACTLPSMAVPAGFASWDAWLASTAATGGGGKSISNATTNELVVVTASGVDPVTVTVAVCWRHRNRTLGECTRIGGVLSPNPGAGGDPLVTESPAMLSTMITCRK